MTSESFSYASPKQLAEECVQIYLDAYDSAITQARGAAIEVDSDMQTSEAAVQRSILVWSLLQRARIFVIDPMTQFGKFYQAADQYSVTQLAGLDFKNVKPGDHQKLLATYQLHVPRVPFPEPLPFESIFLAYGKRFGLTSSQVLTRIRQDSLDEMGLHHARLLGHVLGIVGEQPYAFSVLGLEGRGLKGFQIAFSNTFDKDGWDQPLSLDCWVLNSIVATINDHKKVVVENPVTLGMKFDFKKKQKQFKKIALPLPRPYYVLKLQDGIIDETIKKVIQTRLTEYSHRFDVRGHECLRIVKGPLPLDSDLEIKLRKLNYRIYTINPILSEDLIRLGKRKISPLRRDEWLAIKNYWKDPYIKGSKSLPYIPATRKV